MSPQRDCNADYNKNMNHCGLPYPVQKCLSLLNESGYEAFVVGGAVRDMYLGRPIHDYLLISFSMQLSWSLPSL